MVLFKYDELKNKSSYLNENNNLAIKIIVGMENKF